MSNQKYLSFIISFHEAIPVGPAYDLRKYLNLNLVKKMLFISHPLLYNKSAWVNSSRYEYFETGKLKQKKTAFHWILPEALLYIKDFLYTLFWCISLPIKYEVFIGLNPLNALCGLLLKKVGKVQKVIYYSIDYFPNRFKNKLMNILYHSVDRICVKFCDETWNVSPNMVNSRGNSTKQQLVPIGVWFKRTKRLPFSQINKNKLVFIGYVDITSGIELAVRAMPHILANAPKARLEIVGSGPQEDKLKKMAQDLNIQDHIIFHGLVTDRIKVEKILSDGAVGLVLFNTKIFKQEVKNADPMKLKDYMVLGMPVISTDAISTAEEIQQERCGMIIHYNRKEFVVAVLKLLQDEKLLKTYRQNALSYVSQFDIENIYGDSLKRLLAR